MLSLGDPCIVSAQCPEGQVCHPLSKVCSCPFGLSNCTKMKATESPNIIVSDETPEHHKHILKTLLAEANKTFHETLNQTQHDLRKSQNQGWSDEQVQTMVYIALALLIMICISIIRYTMVGYIWLWSKR